MIKLTCILLLLTLSVIIVDCARILAAFPSACRSHHQVFRPVIKALLDRNHEIVVLTSFPEYQKDQAPKGLTEIDIQEVTLKGWADAMANVTNDNSVYNQGKTIGDIMMIVSEKQLNTKVVQDLLNNDKEKFDLIITENYIKSFYYLSYKYKAPLVLFSSLDHLYGEIIGFPVHPILYPQYLRVKLNNLTIWDTVTELYNDIRIRGVIWGLEGWVDAIIQKLDSRAPSIRSLYDKIDLMVGNVHRIWNFNRPVPPSAVYLYGTHLKPPVNLSEDIQTYLDSSTHGVIYLSFGTSVSESQLPNDKIQSMLKVFSKLPYNVLWKWNADEILGQPKNVLVRKWFQQADILRHPKVKLFITQGGLQSIDEAIDVGVPLLAMPIVFDQFSNAERIKRFGMGQQLDIFSMTEDMFRNTVQNVIGDKRYRHNVEKIRDLFHDQPQGPLQSVVWWSEYVLRHGGASHLRCPAANMYLSEYYEVELIVIVFSIVLAIVVIVCFCVKRLIRCVISLFEGDKVKRY